MKNSSTHESLLAYNNILKENDDIYRGISKIFGMPECTFWILYTLRAENVSLTQSEICDFLYQPKQTVNSALKKLEAEGYIELRCINDRRSKQIYLKEKGVALAEKTVDKVLEAEYKALFSLTDEEQREFIELLQKYTNILKSKIRNIEINKAASERR